MNRASAPAKINIGLVVGPRRGDGKHEIATVLQQIDITDRIELERADALRVEGFADDTLVRCALEEVARAAGVAPAWRARIEKRIPVAAGLGGGSSDAATALRLACRSVAAPLDARTLRAIAARLGSDVPFFLEDGPQLATGDGTDLESAPIPQDFWVVVVVPRDARKESTAAVYARFDERSGHEGFAERRRVLLRALASLRRASDLGALPSNDLASSPHVAHLRELGAFRADVSGAGPAVYALFARERDAERAASELARVGRVWLTAPAWYG